MPELAIESRFGVLMILFPLKPTSPQPRSSHIIRMTFGLSEFALMLFVSEITKIIRVRRNMRFLFEGESHFEELF